MWNTSSVGGIYPSISARKYHPVTGVKSTASIHGAIELREPGRSEETCTDAVTCTQTYVLEVLA